MTQAELDQNNREQNDGSDFSAARERGMDTAGLTPERMAEKLAEAIFGPDPDSNAQNIMDETVKRALIQYRTILKVCTDTGLVLDGSLQVSAMLENFAGKLMFTEKPGAIAFTLAIVLRRYHDLLRDWAALYVGDGTDLPEDWDGLEDEAREAVREAAQSEKDSRTGMYL